METKEKIPVIEKEKNAVKEKHTGKNGRKKKHITSFIEPNLKTILIALFALVACIILLTTSWKGDKGRLTTVSKSSLQKMIEIDELSTIESPYNAVVTKYNKKNKAMYHVAYEGIVTAGVDASKIDLEVDEENALADMAQENAISCVEALIRPLINSIDNEYKVEINGGTAK